jgi:hypothetical protein
MLLRRDVAQHRRAQPADVGGADAAGDVVVARRDVGDQRSQRVERRFVAVLELFVHVALIVHRHVARAFDHHLHVVLHALAVSSPSVRSSPNWASSFESAISPDAGHHPG